MKRVRVPMKSKKTADIRIRAIRAIESFRPVAVGGRFLLACIALFFAASSASAAITFDRSSASAAAQNTRSITWRHTLGSGFDRAVVVGVASNDFILFSGDIATVTFNGVAMHAVPNSHA